jgi:hypothetical protein
VFDWQTIAVAAAIVAAVVYLLRQAVGKRGHTGGCGSCRCADEEPKTLIPSSDLVSRLRRRS